MSASSTPRAWRAIAGAASWGAPIFAAIACSSSTTLPPSEPDCNGNGDAGACMLGVSAAGGSASPPPDGGGAVVDSGGSGVATDDAGACGTAGSLVIASSAECTPCVETSCCAAAGACSDDTACLSIVRCANECVNAPACVTECVDTSPAGAQDFDDFASCLAQSCSPECPTLTPGVGGDP